MGTACITPIRRERSSTGGVLLFPHPHPMLIFEHHSRLHSTLVYTAQPTAPPGQPLQSWGMLSLDLETGLLTSRKTSLRDPHPLLFPLGELPAPVRALGGALPQVCGVSASAGGRARVSAAGPLRGRSRAHAASPQTLAGWRDTAAHGPFRQTPGFSDSLCATDPGKLTPNAQPHQRGHQVTSMINTRPQALALPSTPSLRGHSSRGSRLKAR